MISKTALSFYLWFATVIGWVGVAIIAVFGLKDAIQLVTRNRKSSES